MRNSVILVCGLLLLDACATVPRDADSQSITFIQRDPQAICVGDCPSFDLTLRSDGLVEVRDYALDEHFRFQIAVRLARAIITEIAALRPDREYALPSTCPVPPGSEGASFDPKIIPFQIQWRSQSGSARILACDENRDVSAAFGRALAAMGLYADAHPFIRRSNRQRVSCDLGNGRWSAPQFDCNHCPPDAIKSSAVFYAVDVTRCTVEPPTKQR